MAAQLWTIAAMELVPIRLVVRIREALHPDEGLGEQGDHHIGDQQVGQPLRIFPGGFQVIRVLRHARFVITNCNLISLAGAY